MKEFTRLFRDLWEEPGERRYLVITCPFTFLGWTLNSLYMGIYRLVTRKR